MCAPQSEKVGKMCFHYNYNNKNGLSPTVKNGARLEHSQLFHSQLPALLHLVKSISIPGELTPELNRPALFPTSNRYQRSPGWRCEEMRYGMPNARISLHLHLATLPGVEM